MASLLNVGRGLLKKGLPYDAEIEYLQSSGSQYIDTMLTPLIGDSFYCEFLFVTELGSGGRALYSAGTDTYQTIFLCAKSRTVNGAYFKHFRSGSAVDYYFYPTTDTWYALNVSKDGVATVGGYTATTTPQNELDGANTSLWLFKRRNNTSGFIGRIRKFSIARNESVIFDLIPVRVGTTGYLYDKVSGILFGNAGTGSFILGSDKTN